MSGKRGAGRFSAVAIGVRSSAGCGRLDLVDALFGFSGFLVGGVCAMGI